MALDSEHKEHKEKKYTKIQTKHLNFWGSVQSKGESKVLEEAKYKKEMRKLRHKVGLDVVNDYIWGKKNERIDDFLSQKEAIDKKYAGKRMSASVDDQGNYVYSDEELSSIQYIKENKL